MEGVRYIKLQKWERRWDWLDSRMISAKLQFSLLRMKLAGLLGSSFRLPVESHVECHRWKADRHCRRGARRSQRHWKLRA